MTASLFMPARLYISARLVMPVRLCMSAKYVLPAEGDRCLVLPWGARKPCAELPAFQAGLSCNTL